MAYATGGNASRWPDGLLPYEISIDFDDSQRSVIERAIEHWNSRTIMRLVRRTHQVDFVVFEPADGSCSSNVGRIGGRQRIGCDVGDGFSVGSVIHEIGHSVGYFHEQQRPDRDLFVRVNDGNIESGHEFNFTIRLGGVILGPYDYGSIMHYPRDAFSTGDDTIEPLQDVEIGQRDGLSTRDVLGICGLYEAPHFVVAWDDDSSGSPDVQWAGLTRWKKYCWGPEAAGLADSDDRHTASVAIDQERTSLVVRTDGRTNSVIRARCRTINGAERFDERTVSAGAGTHDSAEVAMAPGGDFVVVWQTALAGGGQEIRARGFDRVGEERFAAFVVSEGSSGIPAAPVVGMDSGGGFVVAWGELRDESLSVHARGFELDGVSRFERIDVADDLGDQDVFPRIAVAGDGSFVVVYELAMREVRVRGFSRDGSERFPEIAANSNPVGPQLLADVAITPSGRHVVTWTDDRNVNGLGQVRARAFDSAGAEVQPEFTLNPRGGGSQLRPRVALDGAGRFFLVFEDDEDGNDIYQIHAHARDGDGAVFLKSLTVNKIWKGQQRRPAVASR